MNLWFLPCSHNPIHGTRPRRMNGAIIKLGTLKKEIVLNLREISIIWNALNFSNLYTNGSRAGYRELKFGQSPGNRSPLHAKQYWLASGTSLIYTLLFGYYVIWTTRPFNEMKWKSVPYSVLCIMWIQIVKSTFFSRNRNICYPTSGQLRAPDRRGPQKHKVTQYDAELDSSSHKERIKLLIITLIMFYF